MGGGETLPGGVGCQRLREKGEALCCGAGSSASQGRGARPPGHARAGPRKGSGGVSAGFFFSKIFSVFFFQTFSN
jgi:hypothetical protein